MSNVYWVLTGPTASGKTAALLQQASTRPMVAISADSRQVYRHMDIGTGSPTTDETNLLSHKVINVISPLDGFNAHSFIICAAQALKAAKSQNLEPWVVGGTGLYIRALVENLQLGYTPRPRLREAIGRMIDESSPQAVATKFGATTSDNSNPVRVSRAIENICVDQNRSMAIYQLAGLNEGDYVGDTPIGNSLDSLETRAELKTWSCGGLVAIDPGKEELLANIRQRVGKMFNSGLVEEVATLRDLGYGAAKVVSDGLGYREAGGIIDGSLSLSQAIEETVVRTRQYAKRQRTYFNNRDWKTILPSEFPAWIDRARELAPV